MLAATLALGQIVSHTKPADSHSHTMLDMHLAEYHADLPHNAIKTIQAELQDEQIVRDIGLSAFLKEDDLAHFNIVYDKEYDRVTLYGTSDDYEVFETYAEALRTYARARAEGHTKDFLLAGLVLNINSSSISNPAIRAIIELHPKTSLNLLNLSDSGAFRKKAGEVASHITTVTTSNGNSVTNEEIYIPKVDELWPWEAYTLVDGDVCWRYFVSFKGDGTLKSVSFEKFDAKDFNPKYRDLMKDVDNIVTEEMKEAGTFEQFGSVHTFWRKKKEELKTRGIKWRSPGELNPLTCYD